MSGDIPGRGSVVVTTCRFCTINTRPPFDDIQIELQNALLTQDEFGHRYKCGLSNFAEDRAPRPEEKVFYELLRKG